MSISVCEIHWGTFEEGTTHCNVGEPCSFAKYVRASPSPFIPDVTELETFDALWNLDESRFERDDVEVAYDLVRSFLGGNFKIEEVSVGRPVSGYRAGTRGRNERSQIRPRRR
jgi:hypothetical protein